MSEDAMEVNEVNIPSHVDSSPEMPDDQYQAPNNI
jgi:hypothetical protein